MSGAECKPFREIHAHIYDSRLLFDWLMLERVSFAELITGQEGLSFIGESLLQWNMIRHCYNRNYGAFAD
jgi:hypothetical protein